ncbi:hypothetical protein [Parapedomonas caeni]
MARRGWVVALAGGAAVALAACATPRSAVTSGLEQFGVPARSATCMAERMDKRLSRDQMTSVARLLHGARKAETMDPSRRNVRKALDVALEAADPEIATVTLKAGVACLLAD